MFQECMPVTMPRGGENYLATNYTRYAASGAPSFTTVRKAKAIFIIINRADGYGMVYTNINPTTGDISPDHLIYRCWSRGSTDTQNWQTYSGTVTITENSVVCNNALAGATAYDALLIYSYE